MGLTTEGSVRRGRRRIRQAASPADDPASSDQVVTGGQVVDTER